MLKAYVKFQAWMAREEGQGMTEYALIIGLIAVVLIGALTTLEGGIAKAFTAISSALGMP